MFYVIIKGKHSGRKILYDTKEEAEAGWARAKRKIAFSHCDIRLEGKD